MTTSLPMTTRIMMRKIRIILLCLAFSLVCRAADFINDGFAYQILSSTNKTVEVVCDASVDYRGVLIIPAVVSYKGTTYKVVAIGDGAFLCRYQLKAITLPNTVKHLSNRAFYGCTSLSAISLGDSIESIGHYVFHGCEALTEITIPATTHSIGRACFTNCKSLRHLSVNTMTPPVFAQMELANAYQGIQKDSVVVFVPQGSTNAYHASYGWNFFTHIIDRENCDGKVLLSVVTKGEGCVIWNGRDSVNTGTFPMEKDSRPTVIVKAGDGYTLKSITLNDMDMLPWMQGDTLRCPQMTHHSVLKVLFEKREAFLTLCHDRNGSLQIDIQEGQPVTLHINANEGWRIYSVTLDGEDVTEQVDAGNCLRIAHAKSGMSIRVILEKDGQFAVWNANGLQTYHEITHPMVIPDEAVAVDLSDILSPEVIPNSNPNTLYLVDDGSVMAERLHDHNVICDDKAQTIHLVDGHDIYVPFDVEVEEVDYVRTPMIGTDGHGGWEGIVIPFSVGRIERADNHEALDWHHGEDDKDKNMWVCDFSKVSANGLFLHDIDQWEANRPYLMAIPAVERGSFHDLRGCPLLFRATHTTLHHTQDMSYNGLYGTLARGLQTDVYTLNEQGDAFVWRPEETIDAFRSFLVFPMTEGHPAILSLTGSATGIRLAERQKAQVGIYNLQGIPSSSNVKVGQGIYIIEGKKTIVK